MESPLLARHGAVAADGADAGVAAHYGDPFAEQRALARASGMVDRSHRGVVRITGDDRLRWLNDLTTQDLLHLAPGAAAQTLVLSPKGHVEHHLTVTDDGSAAWVNTEPGAAGPLLAFLESMRFLMRVDPANLTAEFGVLTLLGPARPEGDWPAGVVAAMHDPFATDLVVTRDRLPAVVAELAESGVALAGMLAYEALRIAAHRPRPGLDTDHRTIPHEVGWIGSAVHLGKGCYRGQETVARVENLGHPPRRLVFLHLDGSEDRLPRPGDALTMGDATVGFTGSAARHFELGPIALGLVKRTVPVDAALRAGGIAAAPEVVVPPDTGGSAKQTLTRFRASSRE